MEKLNLFKVNLQQGFLLEGEEAVAAFNRHTKRIFVKVPYLVNPDQVPDGMGDFEIIHGKTDSFSLCMWTNEGYRDLESLKLQSSKNLKDELEARGYCTSSLWHVEDVFSAVKELNEREGDDHRISFQDAQGILEQAFGYEGDKSGDNDMILGLVEEFLGI